MASAEEILNIWERGDKDTTDLFRLVKDLDLDRDVNPTDWLKENLRKKGEEGDALRKYYPDWYKERLKEYYDAQEQLQTGKGQYKEGKYQDTKIEDLATGKKYIHQPGVRGATKGDMWYSKSRDKAHKAHMKKQEADKAKKLQDEKDAKNKGFFGKMMHKLKTDADTRDKFFDYMGSMGAEISRPTDPGEARSLARDLIVGSQKGRARRLSEAKTRAAMTKDMADAQQAVNPMQYYTSKMKELTQEAIAGGLVPGTFEFTQYIGRRLRDYGISETAANYSKTLGELQEALQLATATGDDQQIKSIHEQIRTVQENLKGVLAGSNIKDGKSDDIPYSSQI